MNEDEIRDLFREMREDPIPVESLVRVRARVEDGIRRRAPWKIAAWVAACAALAVAGMLMQSRPVGRKTPRPQVAIARPAAPNVEAAPVEEQAKVRPAIGRRAHRPRIAPRTQLASIRIETPDPTVVILLVGE